MDGKLPTALSDIRASDEERERTAAVLNDALATGRLTVSEYDARLGEVYGAATRGALARLTADLPVEGPEERRQVPTQPRTTALFSKVWRHGQWIVGSKVEAHARFGVIMMNMSSARFTTKEVLLDASSFCGKIVITVPANAEVFDEGTAIFAKRRVSSSAPQGADGPLIRITGRSLFSKLTVSRAGDKPLWPWPGQEHS